MILKYLMKFQNFIKLFLFIYCSIIIIISYNNIGYSISNNCTVSSNSFLLLIYNI